MFAASRVKETSPSSSGLVSSPKMGQTEPSVLCHTNATIHLVTEMELTHAVASPTHALCVLPRAGLVVVGDKFTTSLVVYHSKDLSFLHMIGLPESSTTTSLDSPASESEHATVFGLCVQSSDTVLVTYGEGILRTVNVRRGAVGPVIAPGLVARRSLVACTRECIATVGEDHIIKLFTWGGEKICYLTVTTSDGAAPTFMEFVPNTHGHVIRSLWGGSLLEYTWTEPKGRRCVWHQLGFEQPKALVDLTEYDGSIIVVSSSSDEGLIKGPDDLPLSAWTNPHCFMTEAAFRREANLSRFAGSFVRDAGIFAPCAAAHAGEGCLIVADEAAENLYRFAEIERKK